MMNAHHNLTKTAVVVLGLALAGDGTAHAQMTRGPGQSSGSGSGTGAGGMMGGVQRNQSGSISGQGPGSTGSGTILRGRPVASAPWLQGPAKTSCPLARASTSRFRTIPT